MDLRFVSLEVWPLVFNSFSSRPFYTDFLSCVTYFSALYIYIFMQLLMIVYVISDLLFLFQLPQQENSYDCGLFLLHYLELFLAEAPKNFSPFKIYNASNFVSLFSNFLPLMYITIGHRRVNTCCGALVIYVTSPQEFQFSYNMMLSA